MSFFNCRRVVSVLQRVSYYSKQNNNQPSSAVWKRCQTPRIAGYQLIRANITSKHQGNCPLISIEEDPNDYNKEGVMIYANEIPVTVDLVYESATTIGHLGQDRLYKRWTVNGDNFVLEDNSENGY